jgi:hypothetical protein
MDKDTNEIIECHNAMYLVGNCKLHLSKQCYHNRTTGLHFNLDRTKMLIWAVAIVRCLHSVFLHLLFIAKRHLLFPAL